MVLLNKGPAIDRRSDFRKKTIMTVEGMKIVVDSNHFGYHIATCNDQVLFKAGEQGSLDWQNLYIRKR